MNPVTNPVMSPVDMTGVTRYKGIFVEIGYSNSSNRYVVISDIGAQASVAAETLCNFMNNSFNGNLRLCSKTCASNGNSWDNVEEKRHYHFTYQGIALDTAKWKAEGVWIKSYDIRSPEGLAAWFQTNTQAVRDVA